MRIAVAADQGGFCQKDLIIDYIKGLGHEVTDFGTFDTASVDYPDYASKVAHAVSDGDADRGVLICGTGIGMALTADKVKGVRAAAIQTPEFVELFREHNDGNVLCLSGRFVAPMTNCELVRIFLAQEFAGGRHAKRVEKIMLED